MKTSIHPLNFSSTRHSHFQISGIRKLYSSLWWFEYPWPMESGPIGRCDLIGGGVTLLEEVCHCGGGL
ncbi:mCG1050540 [Mus musculus]|nr:mCG1050540 [Mus musculus]